MSAEVIYLPKPGTFATPAYPAGVPDSLDTNSIVIDSAADSIVCLAGLEWDAMTPSQKQEAREAAILAAVMLHPEGLRLLGYSMAKTLNPAFTDAPPVVRKGMVDAAMAALRGAALRVSGVTNPQAHRALVDLIAQDAGQGKW